MNFYDVLEINKDATIDVIKKQYKKLALKHHPDRGGDPEMFKKISEAYQTLSDPEKRKDYDNPNPFSQNGMSGGRNFHQYRHNFVDPNIIFQQFFANANVNGAFHQNPQGQNTKTFNIRTSSVMGGGMSSNVFQKSTSTQIRGNMKVEITTEIKNGVKTQQVRQTNIETGEVVSSVNQQIGV